MTLMRKARNAVLVAALAAAGAAQAGDPSARDWIPAPPGTNLLAVYLLGLGSHGFYDQGNRLDGGPTVDVQGMVLRPMHFGELFGKTVQYELILPAFRTTIGMDGFPDDRVTGVGDAQLGAAVWFVNNEETKTWFAWEPFITVPTGKYHSNHADASPGKNRWTTLQDFAFVQGFGESTFLEAVAEFEFFGDNNNYYGSTLKKSPAIRLMALASTNITADTYVGMRYRYETGGREKIDGVEAVGRANNHQLAFEVTHQLNDANQVQLQYIHDLKVENGPRMRGVQLRYVYAF
ncbi:transporter [Castellaniella sp.]|uniref:transporter n=1 Tax=Castellaniella sp. TaxID=1955812 RepID=UPI002AFECB82|nr:transporter [Castellaniella sp.]